MIKISGFRPSHLSCGGPLHPYTDLPTDLIEKIKKIYDAHKINPTPKSLRSGFSTISKGFITPEGVRLDQTIYIEQAELQEPRLYLVLDELGKGSFAKTNLIVSLTDGILYVLRRSKQIDNQERAEAVNQELFAKKLTNYAPGCVEILDIKRYSSIPKDRSPPNLKQKMILRFYQVGDLFNRSFRSIPFLPILQDLIKGIEAIHSQGLVHSDLKPENIFYGWDDRGPLVAVGDYGKGGIEDSKDAMTVAPTVISLRQIKILITEKLPNNTKSDDIWAFGLVLVELLGDVSLRLTRNQLIPATDKIYYKFRQKLKLINETNPKKFGSLHSNYQKVPSYATPYAEFCLHLDELRLQLQKEENPLLRKIASICLTETPPTIEEIKEKVARLESV